MRAPVYHPAFAPVTPAQQRFVAPGGITAGGALGAGLYTAGAALDRASAITAMSEDSAARARALQDRAALNQLVGDYRTLAGGQAVGAQASTLDRIAALRDAGSASLGTPGMQAAYDTHAGPAFDAAAAAVNDHALDQTGVERRAVLAAGLAAAQGDAVAAWHNPARFAAGLDAVGAAARDAADGGAVAVSPAAAIGTAVHGAIGRAIDAGDPDFALHLVAGFGHALDPAARNQVLARLSAPMAERANAGIFNAAVAGGGSGDAVPPGAIAMNAPDAAAIHPLIGGTVTGADDAVTVAHPDGTSAIYSGLGLTSVSPGHVVTPASVIGSAGPATAFAMTGRDGAPIDAGAMIDAAGGVQQLVGDPATPRGWDSDSVLARIGGRDDLDPATREAALAYARRRIGADGDSLAIADLAAGRAAALHVATSPVPVSGVADLPPAIAAGLTPASLASLDAGLRVAATGPAPAMPDGPVALRLELAKRNDPAGFVGTNLVNAVGRVTPAELAALASDQAALAGDVGANAAAARRGAALDAIATSETANGQRFPDADLPAMVAAAAPDPASPVGPADPN